MNLGILKLFRIFIITLFLQTLYADVKNIKFDLIKKGIEDDNTLLIVGGIQGDEPGGFMAASLISTHYTITKGSVWVAPNLNFYSIIKRGRGSFGDMNRKFETISTSDPDFNDVQRVKEYIANPNVKVVVNLHDGSGFYRESYVDELRSPYKWGQTVIIDQSNTDIPKYGNLEEIATKVTKYINKNLIEERDTYSVKNTRTSTGNQAMAKTLTYFAINQGKAAFGNEASKQFPVYTRAYYHILALEEYMRLMSIEFQRNFDSSPQGVKNALYNDIYISFYDDKIKLPLSTIRTRLNYFPISKNGEINFSPSNPLMAVVKNNKEYAIHYGNVKVVSLKPDYLEMTSESGNFEMEIDGIKREVAFGEIVNVEDTILVQEKEGYRVNIIGFTKKGIVSETGVRVSEKDILKHFSVDKRGKIFRIEFYKGEKFAGMVLVNFDKNILIANESSNKAFQKTFNAMYK